MKKIIFILVFLLILPLTACGPKMVNITFLNDDGSVLYETKIEEGRTVDYEGVLPTKTPSAQYDYIFDGWIDENNNSPFVEQYTNNTFYPTFQSILRKYEVSFINYDGTLLDSYKVSYGSNATYNGKTPTRSYTDEDFAYKFIGWDKDPNTHVIRGDTTFEAKFELLEYFTVSFLDYDGTLLYEDKVLCGDSAKFNSSNEPSRPSEEHGDYTTVYTFSGWNKSLDNVTSSFTVSPTFKSKEMFNGPSTTYKNFTLNFVEKLPFSGHTNYNGYTTFEVTSFRFGSWDVYSGTNIPYVTVYFSVLKKTGSDSAKIFLGIRDTYNGSSLVVTINNLKLYQEKDFSEKLSFNTTNPTGVANITLKYYEK